MRLRALVEREFFSTFLPVFEADLPPAVKRRRLPLGVREKAASQGEMMYFVTAPPPLGQSPSARPDRLRAVVKRLGALYNESLDRKVSRASQVIETLARASGKIAVAFSGGRDSLVALHLTRELYPGIPVLFVNTGVEFPETVRFVRQLAITWRLNLHEVKPATTFWRVTSEQGLPVGGRGNTTFLKALAEGAAVHLSNSCCRRLKETPARQFLRKSNIQGMVTGLRTQESRMRALNFADYGAVRFSGVYNSLVGWPLYSWRSTDVDEYLLRHRAPSNPLYAKGYRRVGCWPCLHDMFFPDSRLFILRQQHPRMYEALVRKLGPQLIRLLSARFGLGKWDFRAEHFDGLYRPCLFELLGRSRS